MKNWKVGSLTAGVMFILIGIVWFLKSFLPIPYPTLLFNLWPLVCICLGVETLVFQIFRKEDSLRFHWISMVLLVFMLFVSISFGYLSVFYDKELSL